MAAVAACSLAACGEDTTEPQPQVKLEAHPAELVFDAKGGSQELPLVGVVRQRGDRHPAPGQLFRCLDYLEGRELCFQYAEGYGDGGFL